MHFMVLVVQIYENNNFVRLLTINYRNAQLIYDEKVYKCLFFNNLDLWFQTSRDHFHPFRWD